MKYLLEVSKQGSIVCLVWAIGGGWCRQCAIRWITWQRTGLISLWRFFELLLGRRRDDWAPSPYNAPSGILSMLSSARRVAG